MAGQVLTTGERALSRQVRVGKERLCDISFSPLRGQGAGVTGVLVVAVDVTDHMRALREAEAERERLRALDHATNAVAAEVEPRRELAALAGSVVPNLADACAIYLWHPATREATAGTLTRVACTIDPALHVAPPRSGVSVTLPPLSPIIQAVRRRRAVVTMQARKDDDEPWLAALPVTSLVAVPVQVANAVHAVVVFVTANGKPPFQASDISLLREITARATVAVDHALRLERTTEVSLALQRSFLSAPPRMPGMSIAVRYRPAGPGLEIGGDWYDALRLPDGGLAIAIGDVVGHDLPAATTMAQLRSMLQALACLPESTPAKVLTRLNQIADHLRTGSCATLICGQVHRGKSGETVFSWANAGHPPPLLLAPDPGFLHGAAQPLLGLSDKPYRQDSIVLPPGSTLLFYTDGLIEHRHDSDDPMEALAKYVSGLDNPSPEELVTLLDAWAPSEDDLALLALRT
ncbi:MAG TPA: PP2C family protein-serine/threonine phosphatase [Candidatus Limnocylindrales bacterium]